MLAPARSPASHSDLVTDRHLVPAPGTRIEISPPPDRVMTRFGALRPYLRPTPPSVRIGSGVITSYSSSHCLHETVVVSTRDPISSCRRAWPRRFLLGHLNVPLGYRRTPPNPRLLLKGVFLRGKGAGLEGFEPPTPGTGNQCSIP